MRWATQPVPAWSVPWGSHSPRSSAGVSGLALLGAIFTPLPCPFPMLQPQEGGLGGRRAPGSYSSYALLLPWHWVTEHPWCTRLLLKYWLGKTSARQLSGAFATGTEQTGAWRSCVPPRQGDPAAISLLLNLPCA